MLKRSLLVLCALAASMVPVSGASAQDDTQIGFVNPATYSESYVPELSDEEGRAVHLVAWVAPVPAAPSVEFELVPDELTDSTGTTTVQGQRSGESDIWAADLILPPQLAEGDYTLTGRVFSATEEVAITGMDVSVDHASSQPEVETVDLVRPENNGALGFYLPPGKGANTAVSVAASRGTEQVRVLYTMSAPGTVPVWKQCGRAARDPASGVASARCTLDLNDSPTQVTAIAAVANNTPISAAPKPSADDASDASRIVPFLQVPTTVEFDEDGYVVGEKACRDFRLRLTDQNGDPIAAANLDLHAQGPTDELSFAVHESTQSAEAEAVAEINDPFKQPDRAHGGTERAYSCKEAADSTRLEADHNLAAGPDTKHIETTSGTRDDGSFTFTLFSPDQGQTVVTVWVDGNDDDLQGADEETGFGRIGWGVSPPPPPKNVVIDPGDVSAPPGQCQRTVLEARSGNDPLPGVNIDLHARGPNTGVTFCTPVDGTPGRLPDQGEHQGGVHDDSTKHLEGETDVSGRFIFGLSSSTEGETVISGWIDETDDDSFGSTEPYADLTVYWGSPPPERVATTVTLAHRAGFFGGKVKSQSPRCRGGRMVTVKKQRSGRDRVVGSGESNDRGAWVVKAPRGGGKFYAVVGSTTVTGGDGITTACARARSRIVGL